MRRDGRTFDDGHGHGFARPEAGALATRAAGHGWAPPSPWPPCFLRRSGLGRRTEEEAPDEFVLRHHRDPYVNARPHLGFAFELVAATSSPATTGAGPHVVRHRHRREQPEERRRRRARGLPVRALVERNAAAFRALGPLLDVAPDDFVRTSTIRATHEGGRAPVGGCVGPGDLYRRPYGPVLRRCERSARRGTWTPCPEQAPPRSGRGGELLLPVLPLREPLAALLDSERGSIIARIPTPRDPRVPRSRVTDFSVSRRHRARGLGTPGARRPGPGHLRLVRRARELHHGPRLGAGGDPAATGAKPQRVQ